MSKQISPVKSSEPEKTGKHSIKIISFGFKEGNPPRANLLLDVRFLKNPFWEPELRELTGLDQAVQDYVLEQVAAKESLDKLVRLIESILPQLNQTESAEYVVAIGCTGGQHRSVSIAEALCKKLKTLGDFETSCTHREINGN